MQVKVSARHGHLGDDIQSQLKEKGEKLLHFFNRLTMIEVTVDLHKTPSGKLKVEILATAEHKHEFVATDEDGDVFTAFNKAVAHIKQQITHYKEKIQDHRRDPDHGGNNLRGGQ
ncbi:Sigma 54 modulation protein / S30EA ribosomal protein [Gemmata sp. SH-PL17]|uniref:ribosome hibernation-promoting factor, HPF/YfiA family n=1 Tax=Gemmata sp. SH-PL17 TaxID=1630693 RepID=UPI0004AE6F9C|nr:ribosome-associated translation inhibitor RaiA [Gemmata sp. SH-PL17]AMV26092.1 Sigma 54 modulation protein / S30EA ribosomal protein [Gemmata sp. SH-PL17]